MRYAWRLSLAALTLAAGTAVPVAAQTARVVVNDREVYFRDQQPVERDGRVYIPLRGVLERLGADTIRWRPAREEVFVASGDREVLLRIGDTRARVDGREVWLDAPPILLGERTMVPLRFVSENLGATVRWDSYRRTAFVSAPEERVAGRRETIADRRDDRADPPRRQRPGDRDAGLVIRPLRPVPGEAINSFRPEIAAVFRTPGEAAVDHDSIRMWVNGEDVTRELEIGVNSVTYRPTEELDRGLNRVRLTVRDQDGQIVTREWDFRVR